MRKRILTWVMLGFVSLGVGAQDSIDDLFNDAESGVIEEETEEQIDIAQLTRATDPVFSGKASADAALSVGLSSWDSAIPLEDRIDFSALYGMSSSISLDVRPSSVTRFRGALSVQAPGSGTVTFGELNLNELFLEYTLNSLFFRVGMQSMRWGNGELFNPGNLIAPVSRAMTVRAFTPLGAGLGLTGVALAKDGFFSNPDLPGIAEVGYAGRMEWNLSPLSGALSGYYQAASGLRTAASLKLPVWGVDVSLEGVVTWEEDVQQNTYDGLIATFWEGTDWGLRVVAEYWFESERLPDGLGSRVGVGILATELLDRWNPGIRWYHAFFDNSGEVILGVDGPVADHLRMSIALPISYGDNGTTYRESTEDPLGRAIALVIRATLSTAF
jgi:hypothetical protein